MSLSSTYRIEVFNCFEVLQKALSLAICQQDATLPGWFQAPQQLSFIEANSARKKAMAFIQQLEYLGEQEPREILTGERDCSFVLPSRRFKVTRITFTF